MDSERLRINVVVIGEKNSGKTSIISSLFQFREVAHQSADWETKHILLEKGDNESKNALIEKITRFNAAEYKNYVNKKQAVHSLLNTNRFMKYIYPCRVHCTEFDVNIWDSPALSDLNSSNQEMMDRFLRESNVIIVAIDTPSIMEKHSCKFEVKKRAEECAKMLNGYVKVNHKPKLVIFVPTRCEKYYNIGCMHDVTAKVKELYHGFFDTYSEVCKETEKEKSKEKYFSAKNYAIITPLVTMRHVAFVKYQDHTDLGSAEFHVANPGNYRARFAEKILIGIANYLVFQGMCQTEELDPYDIYDRLEAGLTVATKAYAAYMGVKTPPTRGVARKLICKGEWKLVEAKELICTAFDHGYTEFFS